MQKNLINKVALYISKERWILAKGYKLYWYTPESGQMSYFSRLSDPINALWASRRLTRRLFRAEITHIYHFKNDILMCIAKNALFKYNQKNELFEICHVIEKGTRPMTLCQAQNGTIYYGEYCYNPKFREMRIFQSVDDGNTWTVAYTFGENEINHIHGLFADPYSDKIWVATGDVNHACIFGYTENGFKTFVRLFEGSQQYRVCVPLFTENEIIYATDSQYEQNYIRSIDRVSGTVRNLQAIQGSGIYAVQIGKKMMISTTVEPSSVNKDQSSHLWYSDNGEQWFEIIAYKKDWLPKTYFQFGSLRFPTYDGDNNYLVVTGRAVKKLDGKTLIIPLDELRQFIL